MSDAAVQAVKVFTHPKVKGSARALLEKIAERIPEGQTMTAPIAMDDFAALTGYEVRTMWNACDALVDAGAIRIVGGGRGRTASYELLPLPGAGADPALPLRADLQPVAPRRPTAIETPLLDQVDVPETPASEIGRTPYDLFSYVGLRTYELFSYVRSQTYDLFSYLWVQTYDLFSYVRSPLGVGSRARDVHTSKKEHTHTAAPLAEPSRPPPVLHPWHAWCGPVCVPKQLHQAWIDKGHAEAWLFAFYPRRCATVSPEDARRVVDEFKFWRAALVAELRPHAADARAAPSSRPPPPSDTVWTQVVERIETKVNRHTFYTWFRPIQFVADEGTVIRVTLPPTVNGELFRDWIQKHHHDVLREAVEDVRPGARVEFVTADDQQRKSG